MKYTIITGASGGIGLAMAQELAKTGLNLVLVARSIERLKAIKTELESTYQIKVHIYEFDLSDTQNALTLYQATKADGLTINGLVNNAGVGVYGDFTTTSLDQELAMMDLNMGSLISLCKLYGVDMAKAGGGRIMNVSSLLAFLPFPYYSVYSATKAFVQSFSETLAAELIDKGIVVTALCPGPVDTGFTTSEMLSTNAYKANKPIPASVVGKIGAAHFLNGKGKKVVGFNNWFLSQLPRITPSAIMIRIKKQLASQQKA
jgi:short-subunit dehydrogenase